ncbi:hypothetical protein [Mycolicibacterium sp.]|uniref:hypothetical protein n=1 Tax=Mycolicibacterium sp. TaxID=2320850 RepID=UPI0037C99500
MSTGTAVGCDRGKLGRGSWAMVTLLGAFTLFCVGVSRAYAAWRSSRAAELDRMESIHRQITGSGAGRRWDSEHLNGAIIARLVAEFQGFCRDLHDEAVDHVVTCSNVTDPGLLAMTRAAYLRGRSLGNGNPTWNALKDDFRRLEMTLQNDLDSRYKRSPEWRKKLESAIYARNAVVHSDDVKLAICRAQGDLTLRRAREWRSALNALASGMDRVTGAHLKLLTGVSPW